MSDGWYVGLISADGSEANVPGYARVKLDTWVSLDDGANWWPATAAKWTWNGPDTLITHVGVWRTPTGGQPVRVWTVEDAGLREMVT